MSTYTINATIPAVNVSAAQMVTALGAAPVDVNTEQLLGLAPTSDTTTNVADQVTRTRVLSTVGLAQPLGNPGTAAALANFYTEAWSRAVSSRLTNVTLVFTP